MSIDLHWPYCVYFQLRVERNLAMLENIFFYFISYFFEFGDIKKREVLIEIKREENCSRTSFLSHLPILLKLCLKSLHPSTFK